MCFARRASRGIAGLVFFAMPLSLVAAVASAEKATIYTSPDRWLQAIVDSGATGEGLITFQTTSRKRTLLTRDERSKDGKHGHSVVKAEWTSDSQFFIVSTAATGGHQPWSRPLWICSRSKNRVVELGTLGVNPTDVFTLKDGRVNVPILGCSGNETERSGGFGQGRIMVFDPHLFTTTGKLQIPECRQP
jgi:hypothetical protein